MVDIFFYMILISSFLNGFFNSPISDDMGAFLYIYIIVILIIGALAFVTSTIYIVNFKFREKLKYPIIPLALFFLSFLLAALLSIMTNY